MAGRGSLRGDGAWGKGGGVAGGLEQGSWGLGRVSKGLGGWGLERAEGLGYGGGGWTLRGRPDGRSFARSLARTFGRTENSPLCSIGHRPLWVRCPKGIELESPGRSGLENNLTGCKTWDFFSSIRLEVALV